MNRKKRTRSAGKVVTITNQKGGVGKTTISYHFACFLAMWGYRVAALDLDGQGNFSSRFLSMDQRRNGLRAIHMFDQSLPDLTPLSTPLGVDLIYALNRDVELFALDQAELGPALMNFSTNIQLLQDEYDFVIIDTPPSHGLKMTAACITANRLFVPVELAAFAVEGVVNVVESLKEIMDVTGIDDLKIHGVICNKLRAVNSHDEALAELREAVGPLILKQTLVNRGAVDEALRDHVPVWKGKTSGAQRETAKEMKSLMAEMAALSGASAKGVAK